MGNKSSKVAAVQEQLDAIESRLVGKEQELQSSRTGQASAAEETRALRQQIHELGEQWALVERQRESQLAALNADLAGRADELNGLRRTADEVRVDRDWLRWKVSELETENGRLLRSGDDERLKYEHALAEQTKLLDETRGDFKQSESVVQSTKARNDQLAAEIETSSATLIQERGQRESSDRELATIGEQLLVAEEGLTSTRARLQTTEDQLLAASNRISGLNDIVATLQQQLDEARQDRDSATAQLTQLRAGAATAADLVDQELVSTKQRLESTTTRLTAIDRELATTRLQLHHSQARCDTLQRSNNEAISRRSAMYEAVQALKLELSDSHVAYQALQRECTDLRRLVDAKVSDMATQVRVAT